MTMSLGRPARPLTPHTCPCASHPYVQLAIPPPSPKKAQVLAFSSSGIVFSMMPEVPAMTLAAWRLQMTTAIMIPAAVFEVVAQMDTNTRWRLARAVWTLLLNGSLLALHFGLWVLSLKTTSLPHAMLFVCMAPVIVALSMWIMRQPISWGKGNLGLLGRSRRGTSGDSTCCCVVHHIKSMSNSLLNPRLQPPNRACPPAPARMLGSAD